jgi:cyclic beta-1,2-glucan synthetase
MSTSSVESPTSGRATGPSIIAPQLADHEPIRAEIFGLDHLEAHARKLAAASPKAPGMPSGQPMLRGFSRIGRELDRAHRRIAQASRREEAITPDAEWLIDNYHIVEETLREVRIDLPGGYYRELPKLADGPLAGYPRVYALAVALIAHTDSCLEETNITRFVQAYQTVTPLTIGEVWAVPIMLRLGLLENLRRLARQMMSAWDDRDEAEDWKNLLVECKDLGPAALDRRLRGPAEQVRSAWSDAFVVQLLQALRDHGPDAYLGTEWLENRLRQRNIQPAEVLRREHQRQAANQVSVGNCVTCLRLLSALDWTVFFERTSLVEKVLREDPAAVYARQDFATKDRYRRTVEILARGSGQDELQVARLAVDLAKPPRDGDGQTSPPEPDRITAAARERHVGFYLVDRGRDELEAQIHYRPAFKDRWQRVIVRHPRVFYFGLLTAMMAGLLAGVLAYAAGAAAMKLSGLVLAGIGLAVLLPLSDLAVGLVHYLITRMVRPRVLPKFDFKEGLAADCPTFVVMPTMLLRKESADVLTQKLEVHFLSNPDPQLRFALLTDFADAAAEHMPEDEEYVGRALECIKALNDRYSPGGPERFFLFHRRRKWNPLQNCWMGWERKRGKLIEFNRLLRGAKETNYTVRSGELDGLPEIRYVITLDADTQLPREAASRLVAALAHPLNRPRFDLEQGRVVEGYGVLQPRVSMGVVGARRSLFARLFTGSAGIDPYTTAVSDVYQDLFGVGTFTGKGIYDVDVFEAAVGHTFPENHILSHDLIEGNYARCGLVTDIEFLDDFPARYNVYARREHRWVRGDWQILPWLLPSVPGPAAEPGIGPDGAVKPVRKGNPLPVVERWKIFDNLRRSLVPPALVLLAALGWTVLPGSPWFWTALVVAVPALPLILMFVNGVINLVRERSWRLPYRALRADLGATAGQVLISIVMLAEQARTLLDAIGRTLVRLGGNHRHLLDWETAASTERRLSGKFGGFWVNMWPTPALAALLGLLVGFVSPAALPAALPLLAAWFISPAVAFWVSRVQTAKEPALQHEDRQALRRIARMTWGFFETFVTSEDHWLPPDNFQEDPKGQAAHRTSPTNIGLYLLSALAAHDFGYLSLPALLERIEKTLDTLEGLERFHGHFANWYDTIDLRPLQPVYISTVDSGNLLGFLLTLKEGLREKTEEPIPGPAVREGLLDTLLLVTEELRGIEPPVAAEVVGPLKVLDETVQELRQSLTEDPPDLAVWDQCLARLTEGAEKLTGESQALAETLPHPRPGLLRWARQFAELVHDRRAELTGVAPWLAVLRGQTNSWGITGEAAWQQLRGKLVAPVSIAELHAQAETFFDELKALGQTLVVKADGAAATADGAGAARPELVSALAASLENSKAAELLARCQVLADRAGALGAAMDFKILYNRQRQLFSIGFNLDTNRFDNAHYDLLASEACLASFLAIARGDVPRRHWFQLGRLLTGVGSGVTLLSWGGTMFEYLMPRLLFHAYSGTLLDVTWKAAVDRQIDYGRSNRVPWGISESGFSALDTALDYQYQSFGVPGLGLKRGLARDLVIAPYATALALAVHPRAAVDNLRALAADRAEGSYGYYEAVDYTQDRLREKRRPIVVRSYMAHHQGMALVALANCLFGEPMPRRFHAEPMVRATELLLQERVPASAPILQPHGDEAEPPPVVRESLLPVSRRLTTPDTPHPRIHLLSNRQYSVMVTNAGSGYSVCRDLDVTRWREDSTCDGWGQYCYVRDLRSGLTWSAGYQPLCRPADEYEVIYSTDKAEFRRIDAGIETLLEITVSPENTAEVRRITLTNHNTRLHEIELTSYAEVALAPHGADLAHPAFSKLFLETEYVPRHEALLCRRRPRSAEQKPVWAVHVLAVDGRAVGPLQYETDRLRFLGRGRTPRNPAALDAGVVLSATVGPVLDPVFSLRRRLRVAPGTSASIAFTTAFADTREQALALADQYHDFGSITRAFELAWAHSQVELRHLRLSAAEAHLFQRLAGHVVYTGTSLRAPAAAAANRQGQPGLWRFGISGDRPIVLVRVAQAEELPLVRQLLLAHTYWRLKGLVVDLVVLNDHPAGYREELQEQIQGLVRSSDAHTLVDKPGGVFVRQAEHLTQEDKVLLQAAARVVLAGDRGSLAGQVDRVDAPMPVPPALPRDRLRRKKDQAEATSSAGVGSSPRRPDLLFDNGIGGFTADGMEYVLALAPEAPGKTTRLATAVGPALANLPPAPWVNVVANPACGFIVSESGGGYTWAGNSQANRLTPWNNDPVSDLPGEVVYLRDENTGECWTPTPLPRGPAVPFTVRHGQGYTVFSQSSFGLAQELLLFVPREDPVKLICLKVRNMGPHRRRLSATFFGEWVLGTVRGQAPLQVVSALDPESGALLARNAFNTDFGQRIAFADVNVRPRTFTADRTEFFGRNGSTAAPAALTRTELSGSVRPIGDPCAAVMAKFDLGPGEEKEIIFLLGQADRPEEVSALVRRYAEPGRARKELDEVRASWERVLGTVQVRTPDPALDLMVNRWLLYQALSCRIWGRSAFYQSGGAYGFRDQLQDVMALVYGAPQEARAQILRAASRQFLEGDVQHWWHPPSGRGVRTHFSDDLLWLPLVVCHYVSVTGDGAVLDEKVPFLRGPVLRPDQEEDYGLPEVTEQTATIYDHCVLALDHGSRLGEHGFVLMGTGDWNDGMNRVGAGGKGESVWDAWFLVTILERFAALADRHGDTSRARWCGELGERLRSALEEHAWDGRWYRRAYFDDGTPLGSEQNAECKIDSIVQSWAVISGKADPGRVPQAMAAVEEYLVRDADRLILLFTPPFDHGKLQPGYIKGYLPGIRENGGQYTHAATWVVKATALLGRGKRAVELFDLLNPIRHAQTPGQVTRYRVEPYVVVADIYSQSPHVGRGGWTWYTGSASWLYRVALESILGFHREGDLLRLRPCIDPQWKGFEITYCHKSATYHITVENPTGVEQGVQGLTVDGATPANGAIALKDDGQVHEVKVVLG